MLGGGSFWTVNGDIYTDMSLPSDEMDADVLGHLILVPKPAHKEKGDFSLHNNRVRFAENPGLTYSGIARYKTAFFDGAGHGRFSVAPMLFDAARRDELSGSLYEGVWEDIGSPARLEQLNRR